MNHGMIDWWNCLNGVVFFYFRCRSPLQLHNFRRNRSKSIFRRKIASKLFSDTRRKKRFKCDEFSVGYERMRESKREPWLSAVFHLYPFRWNHRAQFFYAMPNKSIQFPFVIGPVNIASQHGCSIFGATSCQFNIYNFFDNKFIIAHIRNISKSISCVSIMLHKYYYYYEKEEENSRRLSEWDEMLIEKMWKTLMFAFIAFETCDRIDTLVHVRICCVPSFWGQRAIRSNRTFSEWTWIEQANETTSYMRLIYMSLGNVIYWSNESSRRVMVQTIDTKRRMKRIRGLHLAEAGAWTIEFIRNK